MSNGLLHDSLDYFSRQKYFPTLISCLQSSGRVCVASNCYFALFDKDISRTSKRRFWCGSFREHDAAPKSRKYSRKVDIDVVSTVNEYFGYETAVIV